MVFRLVHNRKSQISYAHGSEEDGADVMYSPDWRRIAPSFAGFHPSLPGTATTAAFNALPAESPRGRFDLIDKTSPRLSVVQMMFVNRNAGNVN